MKGDPNISAKMMAKNTTNPSPRYTRCPKANTTSPFPEQGILVVNTCRKIEISKISKRQTPSLSLFKTVVKGVTFNLSLNAYP